MDSMSSLSSEGLSDQADGLRRLFAGSRVRFVPVVSNPHVAYSGVLLEALCSTYAEAGLHTLVVDAGELAPIPNELTHVDLAACVESVSRQVSYLAARGLPMRYTNARGSAAQFLQAVSMAVPHADVVLVHASAAELARVVSERDARPLLLADIESESVTHAYAAMKWLSQRSGLMVYSLLLAAHPQLRLSERIAQQLSSCADGFLGAVLRDWACVNPRAGVHTALAPELRHLARELLHTSAPGAALAVGEDSGPLRPQPRTGPAAPFGLLAAAI